MICGCSNRISLNNQLRELGYSEEDIKLISKLNYEDTKRLYEKYDETLLNIVKDPRCKTENIKKYFLYHLPFDNDTLFMLVNNNYLNNSNFSFYKELVNNKFFIFDNLKTYIKYSKDYSNPSILIGYVNVGAYKEPYNKQLVSDTSKEMDILGNKWHYLDKYEPSGLVLIDKKYGQAKYEQYLKKEAYEAFKKMYDAALKDGIDIYAASTYRSYDFQEDLYESYLKIDTQEVVDTYSSRPGYSDHQIGLSCDILSYKYDFDNFEESKAFTWLSENAEKYGFILRYPKDKEDITGYMYESWHYRYVGEDLAKFINENNLTYDEYHAYYIERGITYEGA